MYCCQLRQSSIEIPAVTDNQDERPRHRIVVRRDRRGAGERARGAGAAPAARTRCTARPTCTGPMAAWCLNWRRATTSAACCRWCDRCSRERAARWARSTSSPTRAGPGLAGALAGGCRRAPTRWPPRSASRAGRASPRGALAVAVPVDRPAAVSVRRAARLGRPHAADARATGSGATSCSARRSTTPRARPSTRPPSCSAWATRAGPRWRAGGAGRADAFALPRPLLHSGEPGLFVCRAEDRGAGAAQQARARSHGRSSAPTSPHRRRRRSSTCWCTSRCARSATRAATDSSSPAASAPTRCCRQRLDALAKQRRFARALPGAGAVHRQRRDDRAGRRDATAARCWRRSRDYAFDVAPRWPLDQLAAPGERATVS